MRILGMTEVGHHSAAALLDGGNLEALAEEERFSRIKGSPGLVPSNAIQYCLQAAGVTPKDIEAIAVGWDVPKYAEKMPAFYSALDAEFEKGARTKLDEQAILNRFHPVRAAADLTRTLRSTFGGDAQVPVEYYNHHECHAASAYYCSGYDEALTIVIDGSGEETCASVWACRGTEMTRIETYTIPNSIGWFYSAVTEWLGFSVNQAESKVMGLAAYGNPDDEIRRVMNDFLRITPGSYTVDPYLTFYGERPHGARFTNRLVELLGQPRTVDEPLTQRHADIARAAQDRLEECVIQLAEHFLRATGLRNLCLAGGVAMNCKLAGRLQEEAVADSLFVQPASYDAGTSLGAAQLASVRRGIDPRFELRHTYYGPEFTNEQIEAAVVQAGLRYQEFQSAAEIAEACAKLVASGKILGWFSGRMEFGARALGNRSILADPRSSAIADAVNNKVKFREAWRPFSPVVLEEHAAKIFEGLDGTAPFMTIAHRVKREYLDVIPAVVHVDGTARPQTVSARENPAYSALLEHFHTLTGVPVLLNTSFNRKDEPIVCTPQDALRSYVSTGLDCLAIGNLLLVKDEAQFLRAV